MQESPALRCEPTPPPASGPGTLPKATWVRPPVRARLHRIRRGLQALTSLFFIAAPFFDLLRFDLKNEALLLATVSFGLGEMGVVYPLIILSFIVVFAGALIYGRLYCGWLCPQTTLSEIAAALDRWSSPKSGSHNFWSGGLAALATLGVSAFVTASLMTYFIDPADRLSPSALAWTGFGLTFAVIAADLLWIRHRFCAGICPYGIIQNISQDVHTLGVSLDPKRRGECTNCQLCVRACFMGIDVRDHAFEPRCLNCGDCLAASRTAKNCPSEPLIRFRYGHGQSRWPAALRRMGIVDGRRVAVVVLAAAASGLVLAQTAGRSDLGMEIAAQYERTSVDASGTARNYYQLWTSNRLRRAVRLRLEVEGLAGLSVVAPHGAFLLDAGARERQDLVLSAPSGTTGQGAHAIKVRCIAEEGASTEAAARFFVPSPK